MTPIIIIGGGLTGLSAAWELETLRIPYTLIEVKPRLGGAIKTERRAGFTLDGTQFVLEKYGAWDFLEPLGLADAIRYVGRYRDGRLAIFKDGTQTLTDALAARITHPVMTRMAVSSVGALETTGGGIGVCLENGLLLQAQGVIVTVPARHISHLIYTLSPEAALLLDDYTYDHIARVQLGYRAADFDPSIAVLDVPQAKFVETYDFPDRVPVEHRLVRVGIRLETPIMPDPAALIAEARTLIPTTADPVMTWVYYWAESDPLTRYLPEHAAVMNRVDQLLPPQVRIAGSDYRAKRIEQQVHDGRLAARQVAEAIR